MYYKYISYLFIMIHIFGNPDNWISDNWSFTVYLNYVKFIKPEWQYLHTDILQASTEIVRSVTDYAYRPSYTHIMKLMNAKKTKNESEELWGIRGLWWASRASETYRSYY